MKRLSHGSFPSHDGAAPAQPADHPNGNEETRCPERSKFNYLFKELQDSPENLLSDVHEKTGARMAETLIDLGKSMHPEPEEVLPANPAFDSDIPSVYTYFGQFITHEVVFERSSNKRKLGGDTDPLPVQEIKDLTNGRTALLDLDSIYGPILQDDDQCFRVPRVNEDKEMDLGFAIGCPAGSDLKRQRKDPLYTAIIGDGRNDANRITSQMHLAFLQAHNKFIERDALSFEEAQRSLRQHFQWLVIYDYLPMVVDNAVLKSVLDGELNIFSPAKDEPFVPLEFSAGAFRFGHSMTRNRYNYNHNYDQQRLTDFFLPHKSGYYPPFSKAWIIDWKRFLPGGQNLARRINTRLAHPLFDRLIDDKGERLVGTDGNVISLAALDLLRGYSLRLPTGQSVAKALKINPISAADIESIAGQVNPRQAEILHDSGLSSRTPLWFYVLAEAAALEDGLRLGPVGSSIVASVLVGLVRCSSDSILREPQLSNWKPSIGDGHFGMAELFKFAES